MKNQVKNEKYENRKIKGKKIIKRNNKAAIHYYVFIYIVSYIFIDL